MGFFWLCVIVTVVALVHEFGHYIAARICGIRVEVFAIGMGKELIGIEKNNTRWRICCFPIGGYVQILGQSDKPTLDVYDGKKFDPSESFENKNRGQKIFVAIAGPLANLFLSFAIFLGLMLKNGHTKIPPVVGEIVKNSAFDIPEIKPGYKILAINGQKISDFSQIRRYIIENNCKKEMFVTFDSGGAKKDIKITPKIIKTQDQIGKKVSQCMLGIVPDYTHAKSEKLPFFDTVKQAFFTTWDATYITTYSLFQLFTGQKSIKELSGPLKIGKFSHEASKYGVEKVLGLIAIISIGIGIMNLAPIPVLDGGHIFMNLIGIIFRRDIPKKAQYIIYQIGIGLVILLMLTGFINDFIYLIEPYEK